MSFGLTPDEIAQLEVQKLQSEDALAKYILNAPAFANAIANAQLIYDAFNKKWSIYDSEIINRYNDEREALNGEYIGDPVTETDLLATGQLDTSGRLTPIAPLTKPTRIVEFDDGGKVTTDNDIGGVYPLTSGAVSSENFWILAQAYREDWLANGLGAQKPTITGTTFVDTAIIPTTTQISVKTMSSSENPIFAVGDTFIIRNGAQQVAVYVNNIVSQADGDPLAGFCTPTADPDTEAQCTIEGGSWTSAPSNYEAVLDINLMVPGSCATGGTLDIVWAGFSDADRIAKVDSTDGYTQLMADMISHLELCIDTRLVKTAIELTSVTANQDAEKETDTITKINTTETFLNAWRVSSIVSDASLATLATERGVRGPEITARIAQINSAYTGRTLNYFDERYDAASEISDTSGGALRILEFRKATSGTIDDTKVTLQATIDSITALLANP